MSDTTAAVPGPISAFGLSIVGAVLVLDQASKFIADQTLEFGRYIDLLPILALLRVNNTGVAFSVGHGLGSLVLVAATAVITLFVFYLWHSAKEGGRLVAAGFALIIGGALGNLIDRVRLGHVVDFLYLHIGDRGFFVFNLADVALTIGPVLLAWFYLLGGRKA
jgi:signal peptidase II